MTGTSLALQISQLRPQTPVLLTTGSCVTWTLEKVRDHGVHDLIEKPATPAAMALAIHRLLNRPAEGARTPA